MADADTRRWSLRDPSGAVRSMPPVTLPPITMTRISFPSLSIYCWYICGCISSPPATRSSSALLSAL